MKLLIALLLTISSFAQEELIEIDADWFIGIDNLEHLYYVKNNTLYKKTKTKNINYTNLHLGKIASVDITNPLKIVVFYKDFNSVIILDDNLNELSTNIDFNSLFFKNIHYVGTATNSGLWLYSQDDNTITLFDFLTKKITLTKQIESDFRFKFASSNYHNLWLFSEAKVLNYNVYGSFIQQKFVDNINMAFAYKNGFIYKHKNKLFLALDNNSINPITLKNELIIKDFYINNKMLYFFDGNFIYSKELTKK
jgi:hypothetical protein